MTKKQMVLNLFRGGRGGRRPGSGRKRIHSKGVSHKKREAVNQKTPLHINFRYKTHIRNKDSLRLLKRAIINARAKGLRVIHFSMQSNHIHIIVESSENKTLTKGMRSLTVTFAKGLKRGKVQTERFHLHVLKSVKEAKNAIRYVLFNQQKHEARKASRLDEYSSLLSLSCGLDLIRNFAAESRMTLTMGPIEKWHLDKSLSYLGCEGLKQLAKKRGPEGPLNEYKN